MVSYHILFPSYCALMLAASSSRVADAAAAFAPTAVTSINRRAGTHLHQRPSLAVRGRKVGTTAVFSSIDSNETTDDKVAALRAAAAKAREQADQLRQVRVVRYCCVLLLSSLMYCACAHIVSYMLRYKRSQQLTLPFSLSLFTKQCTTIGVGRDQQ